MHVSARRGVPFDAARERQQRPRYFSESSSASLDDSPPKPFPPRFPLADLLLQVETQRAAISRKRPERRRPFSPRPRIPFINHGVRPAPRCPATPSRTAPRARPVRPLNRSFARANARSPSTEPANPRAIDRATDLVPSCFPRADRDGQRACDAETPGVAVARRKPDRGTTCPCSAITPMTLRGSRSRRCVRARRPRIANPRADPDIFSRRAPRLARRFSALFAKRVRA